MNTLHFWFPSGSYSLLGHLDLAQPARRVGILIVPPFGWEDVCSYRPRRFMAQSFVRMGISTLRYDLPGTGDSSGDARDSGLFEAWIQSVAAAAAELRKAAPVEEVAVVGIHLGATLALASACRGNHLENLVLWGAAGNGRAILRELRANANVEAWEYLPAPEAPPQPLPGLQSGGFLMSPETVGALESFDASRLPRAQSRRILMLSRDELPHDSRLVDLLRDSVGSVDIEAGRGYSAMMAQPQEAAFPEETSRFIAEFVAQGFPETASVPHTESPGAGFMATEGGAVESLYCTGQSSLEMFGIRSEPANGLRRGENCVLYLNAGGVRHTGPNRMWVESARRWAARGIPSLRLDLHGIGESDGAEFLDIPALYRECLMDQIETAIDSLRRDTGMRHFLAIGLCSGACWAFQAALRNADVRAAVLLNPSLLYWDPAVDRKRMVRRIAGGLTGWAECTKLIRSGFKRGDIQRGMRRVAERFRRKGEPPGQHLQLGFKSVADAWLSLEREKKRVTLVFRHGEELLDEMEASGELPLETNSFARCIRVPNGGHTFRPLWAQKLVHELIDREIENATTPASSAAAAAQPDDGWLSTLEWNGK